MPDSLSTAELDELEKLAKEATPGPWNVYSLDGVLAKSKVVVHESDAAVHGIERYADANFIAALNPHTALRLIAEVRRLRELEQQADDAAAEAQFYDYD